MNTSARITHCLSAILISAILHFFLAGVTGHELRSHQAVLGAEPALTVPGNNPLELCSAKTNDSLVLQRVDLIPNPPKAGQTLLIDARGTFTTVVQEGAFVNLNVKYGLITLMRSRFDLCDHLAQIDESCPISGDKVIHKAVELPKEIPKGKYTVTADVYTKDHEKITCLRATVHF